MLRDWHGCNRQRSQQHQLQGQRLSDCGGPKAQHRRSVLPNKAKPIGYPGGPQRGQIWLDHPSEMMPVIDYCDKMESEARAIQESPLSYKIILLGDSGTRWAS